MPRTDIVAVVPAVGTYRCGDGCFDAGTNPAALSSKACWVFHIVRDKTLWITTGEGNNGLNRVHRRCRLLPQNEKKSFPWRPRVAAPYCRRALCFRTDGRRG